MPAFYKKALFALLLLIVMDALVAGFCISQSYLSLSVLGTQTNDTRGVTSATRTHAASALVHRVVRLPSFRRFPQSGPVCRSHVFVGYAYVGILLSAIFYLRHSLVPDIQTI